MTQYVGVKIVTAWREDRPIDGTGQDGYAVKYEDGYTSWCPKDAFETAYKPIAGGMDFSQALFMLKRGKKISRAGWNGKGMWIVMMPSLQLPPFNSQVPGAKVNDRTAKHIGPDTPLDSLPYIAMWTATGQWCPGWLASQTDLMANDWGVVE